MARRDHEGTQNRIPLGTIVIVLGMALIVFGVGSLAYRQLDSDSGAEAESMVTPTHAGVTPTPESKAENARQSTPTPHAPASPTPTIQARVTPTPSPRPTQAMTPTPQASPTPDATVTPTPSSSDDPEPTQSNDAPTPLPPIEAPPAAPEPPADDSPTGSIITHIQLPAAGIDTPVVEIGYNLLDIEGQTVIQWNVAEWAAGHHSISANPGAGGNVVIAGHVAGAGEVFRNLEYAEVGDEVLLSTTEGEFRYVIEEVHLRLEAGAPLEERLAIGAFMAPMPEDRVTLITCWPYGVYDHRLIVVAKPA